MIDHYATQQQGLLEKVLNFKIGLLPNLIPDYIATTEGPPPQVGPKAPGPQNIFLTILKTHQSFYYHVST